MPISIMRRRAELPKTEDPLAGMQDHLVVTAPSQVGRPVAATQTKKAVDSVIHENYTDIVAEIETTSQKLRTLYHQKAELEAMASLLDITFVNPSTHS